MPPLLPTPSPPPLHARGLSVSSLISFAALLPESPKLPLPLRGARAAGRRGSRRADQRILCLFLEQAGHITVCDFLSSLPCCELILACVLAAASRPCLCGRTSAGRFLTRGGDGAPPCLQPSSIKQNRWKALAECIKPLLWFDVVAGKRGKRKIGDGWRERRKNVRANNSPTCHRVFHQCLPIAASRARLATGGGVGGLLGALSPAQQAQHHA